VTIGVFGYPEHVISEPMTPKDLVKIIYDKCMPFDPAEAVLQQEVRETHCLSQVWSHDLTISDYDLSGKLCVEHIPQFCF
jgi:hypothetical protein